jgi:hypothetical protein
MKTSSSCCGTTTATCDSVIAELPRYYPRQLITPDDLTLEQNYFRDRMRRHNRLLHGWGVVCGALVCPVITKDTNGVVSVAPWQVLVRQGLILGPYGDEIMIDCVRTVDLRGKGVSGTTGDPCIDVPDPWCSQVTTPQGTGTLYIAVKYKQSMTRPVRVQPIGCGCDGNSCECSRWHDGYEIAILDCCPIEGQVPPPPINVITGDIPSCPECPEQPWVVLAAVQVESDGTISSIDNCSCRRLVASAAGLWWKCTDGDTTLTAPHEAPVKAGKKNDVDVKGTNLEIDATYTFGNGISLSVKPPSGTGPFTSLTLEVTPDKNATLGPRTLVVVNKDCSTVTLPDAIIVAPPDRPPTPAAPQNLRTTTRPVRTGTGSTRRPTSTPPPEP